MNPRQAEILIEQVLKERMPRVAEKYKLCIVAGELKCIGFHAPVAVDWTLATLTELQIANGFNSREWAELACKVCKYIEKEASCLNDQKP